MTNHAAQMAIIKHMSRQESHRTAGNYQEDEEVGMITWLSGTDYVADPTLIT